MKMKIYDHKGTEYTSLSAMCKAYNISTDTFRRRRKAGCTIEEALTAPKRKVGESCTDHLGNKYKDIAEMCEAYNIPYLLYFGRLNQGFSQKEALETPVRNYAVKDHLGNEYSTIREMVDAWGINYDYFHDHQKKGESLKDILEQNKKTDHTVKDHLGHTYPSVKDMCKAYGIGDKAYLYRIKHGMGVEEALLTPFNHGRASSMQCKDHLGNTFPSYQKLCEFHDLDRSSFTRYKKLHPEWNIEKIIAAAKTHRNQDFSCKDHLGNSYENMQEMADAYKMKPTLLYGRLKGGWTLEEALTTPSGEKRKSQLILDHLGNVYKTKAEMCNVYGIDAKTLGERLKDGFSLEEALTAPTYSKQKNDRKGEIRIQKCGLSAEIIDYRSSANIDVKFEDGSTLKNTNYYKFTKGKLHPEKLFFYKRHGEYAKHETYPIAFANNRMYYRTTCKICGEKSIKTPQQMLHHYKTHNSQNVC